MRSRWTYLLAENSCVSILLIKYGFCPGCLRPLGQGQGYMIHFWIRLHMRMVCNLVLSVWVQFDKFFVLLKILIPGQSREGTSSLYYIWKVQPGIWRTSAATATYGVPLDPSWPQYEPRIGGDPDFRTWSVWEAKNLNLVNLHIWSPQRCTFEK